MSPSHVCDYCGQKFYLGLGESVVRCHSCGEHRIYDLVNNKTTEYYVHRGTDNIPKPPTPPEDEEEVEAKKSKKVSRDIKHKRTCNSYSMKQAFRGGFK